MFSVMAFVAKVALLIISCFNGEQLYGRVLSKTMSKHEAFLLGKNNIEDGRFTSADRLPSPGFFRLASTTLTLLGYAFFVAAIIGSDSSPGLTA